MCKLLLPIGDNFDYLQFLFWITAKEQDGFSRCSKIIFFLFFPIIRKIIGRHFLFLIVQIIFIFLPKKILTLKIESSFLIL